MKCYTCGGEDVRTVCTWTPDLENVGDWLSVSVCADCDRGCEWELSPIDGLYMASKIAISYGLPVETQNEEGQIGGPEWSVMFDMYSEGPVYYITMWSGSWPFPVDHPKGGMRSIEDAVRYVVWLLKRDEFYQNQLEAAWASMDEEGQ